MAARDFTKRLTLGHRDIILDLQPIEEREVNYRDRHVVVTGGTGALGTAVVMALLETGAICHIPWLHEAEAEHFVQRDHPQVKLVGSVDLADEGAVSRLFGGVPDLWASIHIAGGFAMSQVAKTSKADLMRLVDTNLVSCFLCCSAAVNAMSGTGKGGRIVNVAARQALEWRNGAGMVAYTASKAAVAALTVALSEEVAKQGILVNAVAPSIMDTQANRAAMPKADYATWPKVEEVAATILFLASPENKVTRGGIVPVYGRS
jgi:NAD(P)-dependent dehydrogenase (short-subunit alcohol dehydrogenase family)